MSDRADATGRTFWGDVDDDVALQRYRVLVETIDDGVYQLDTEGCIVAVDETIVETTGYDREKLVGEHVSRLVDDRDAEQIDRTIRSQLEVDTEPDSLEVTIQTAAGTRLPCEVRHNAVTEGDEWTGTIGVVRDRQGSLESAATSFESIANVLDEADVGVLILDEDFTVRWADESIATYFGFDREAIIGWDKRTLIDERLKERFADPDTFAETVFATYDDNTGVERFECRVTADAATVRKERWLEHRSKPIQSGQFAGGRVELYYDITDRKRSEGALEESEKRFRSLVDAVEEYAIFRLDPSGRISSWNEGARQIKGYDSEEILGEHISTFYTDADRAANVPERILERATKTGSVEDEGWRVRKDGSRFWANVTLTAVTDSDGTHQGYLKVTRDMTDRREREQQLQRERDLIDRILEASPVGTIVFDVDGTVTRVNDRYREIFGDDEDELETNPFSSDLVYDESGESVSNTSHPYTQALRTGESVSDRVLRVEPETETDERRWVVVNAVPITDDAGSVDRVVATAEDVTALKERERELESELESILSRITEAFYALDDDWTITYANDRAHEVIGFEGDQLLGRNLWEVLEWGADSKLRREYEHAMAAQEPTSFELYYPDPLETWFETHAYPSETGLSVYFRDITERKRRERKLAESERRYRTLVENFPNGIVALFDLDLEYTLAAGKAFADIPVKPADIEGKHVRDAWDESIANVLEPAFEAALDGSRQSIELTYAGREWVVRVVPIVDEQGDVFAGMTMAQDVTERNRRERALREERNLVERIIDTSPVGIVTLDATGSLERVNSRAQDILGYMEAELGDLTRNLDQLDPIRPDGEPISPPEAPPVRVFEDGETIHDLELGIRRADDQRIWVSVSATPLEDDGEITGAVITFADITERKEYQRKLEASNERLEQFAYAASHDLQEPLRMVSSYLQLIEDQYADELDADGREFIEYAVDGADRMREMIDGLLQYSRVETQGDPFEPADLELVIDDVLEDLRLRIEESNADVTVGDLPTVRGDSDQLRQVFQNLFSNAIEYSDDDPPRIDVTAERIESRWQIDISDNGIGIEPDEQERIFEVFQRLHSREEHPGTGIGLALCQRIIERHGGEIWVDSEPGEGSTFSVTLPAVTGTDIH
ncbi:PAS domain S-box protein [Natronorubrum aibiense]|uniref:histidine kinase n=1 Tax=Natronorubrum aibiense TaxID=348826 RepID=A0A5P9P6U3_9EURY|nr:PAS domain S-box protein [Natronorubrum aibiense]QFU83667.1 PAS domain S-box protein [Natronorubrum aibiense]